MIIVYLTYWIITRRRGTTQIAEEDDLAIYAYSYGWKPSDCVWFVPGTEDPS